ncbi:MAG: hypothetical protein ACKPB4_25615 [Sphaerospermopsis kisseleviana]
MTTANRAKAWALGLALALEWLAGRVVSRAMLRPGGRLEMGRGRLGGDWRG